MRGHYPNPIQLHICLYVSVLTVFRQLLAYKNSSCGFCNRSVVRAVDGIEPETAGYTYPDLYLQVLIGGKDKCRTNEWVKYNKVPNLDGHQMTGVPG
jgi:hypothetical protein